MGRRKIQIKTIGNDRARQVTFSKRRYGILKKAYELSILCGVDIGVIMFNGYGRLFTYASGNLDNLLLRYAESGEPVESKSNADIERMIQEEEEEEVDDHDNEELLSEEAEEMAMSQPEENVDAMFANYGVMGLSTHPTSPSRETPRILARELSNEPAVSLPHARRSHAPSSRKKIPLH
jgi:hypothetical protein